MTDKEFDRYEEKYQKSEGILERSRLAETLLAKGQIPFTQFLLPDGRRTEVRIERPMDVAGKAQELIRAGFRFEIELLRNGMVSMDCSHPDVVDEEGPIASAVCRNGPEVPASVDKVVEGAWERWKAAEP
jgi:hypothetical protein